jgi:hypothetical protein
MASVYICTKEVNLKLFPTIKLIKVNLNITAIILPSFNMPQSHKHSSLLVLPALNLFLFLVIMLLLTLNTLLEAADIAGIAK